MPSRKIHRAAGISAVLFVILFVATGLLLQHAPSLHLHRHHIPASWAYAFYDAQVLGSTDYRTANHWVSQAGHSLYIDAAPVAETELHRLLGAVETADGIWVAADDRLLLLSKQGQVLESLSLLQGLPETAMRLGIAEGALVLGGAHSIWRASASALQWHPLPPSTAVTWSQAASGEGLPIELQRVSVGACQCPSHHLGAAAGGHAQRATVRRCGRMACRPSCCVAVVARRYRGGALVQGRA